MENIRKWPCWCVPVTFKEKMIFLFYHQILEKKKLQFFSMKSLYGQLGMKMIETLIWRIKNVYSLGCVETNIAELKFLIV